MDGEIIKLLMEFDWAIIIPFFVFVLMCVFILKDTDNDYKQQNKILKSKKKESRYND